jgi:hypothetical protein
VVLSRGPSELFGLPLIILTEADDLLDEVLPRLHFLPQQRSLFQIGKIKDLILESWVKREVLHAASDVSASHMGSGLNFSSQASRIL